MYQIQDNADDCTHDTSPAFFMDMSSSLLRAIHRECNKPEKCYSPCSFHFVIPFGISCPDIFCNDDISCNQLVHKLKAFWLAWSDLFIRDAYKNIRLKALYKSTYFTYLLTSYLLIVS